MSSKLNVNSVIAKNVRENSVRGSISIYLNFFKDAGHYRIRALQKSSLPFTKYNKPTKSIDSIQKNSQVLQNPEILNKTSVALIWIG